MPRYIDLTLALEDGMRGVSSESVKEINRDGWNATTFHLYSHAGTHMDAPLHFDVSEQTIDQIPVEKLFVDAWLVDISEKKHIDVKDLSDIADKIQPGEGLIFRSGWSQYIGTPKFREDLPGFSVEFAEWCVTKGIGLVAVEPPSVADVNNLQELTKVHQILLENNIVIIEGLTNLDVIKNEKVQLVALPLKYKGADGAPARVIAIEQD